MKKIKIMTIVVVAAAMVFLGAHGVMAREGDTERAGGEGRGGEGEHGQDRHRHHDNNYYINEGW